MLISAASTATLEHYMHSGDYCQPESEEILPSQIFNRYQRKTFRAGSVSRQRPVLCLQHRLHLFRLHLSSAHPKQSSDDNPDHVVQKTVSGNCNGNHIAAPLHGDGLNGPDMIRTVRLCRAEGGKIMPSFQAVRSFLHPFFIQIIVIEGGVSGYQRIRDRPVPDLIAVSLPHFTETGMEIIRHLLRSLHLDIRRQPRIHRKGDLLNRHPCAGIEDRYIPEGMDPRVRPACSEYMDLFAQQFGQVLIQFFLDRIPLRLDLPSVVGCAVVGYRQFRLLLFCVRPRPVRKKRYASALRFLQQLLL